MLGILIILNQVIWVQAMTTVLSVRFEVGFSLLLAPAGAGAPFPLVENAVIQPVIHKRVPAGALVGAGSY